jgi:putative transposase
MRRRFSTAQIVRFLREAAAGTPIMEVCWNHCVSRSTYRAWKAKYGTAIDAETDRLRQLEAENAKLRKALARANAELARPTVLPAPRSRASYRRTQDMRQ